MPSRYLANNQLECLVVVVIIVLFVTGRYM